MVTLRVGRPLRKLPPETVEAPAAPHAPRKVAAYTYSYQLKDLSIPLADKKASRLAYAQFTLRLDCPSENALRSMKLNRASLLDVVFDVASQFHIEDFDTPAGHERFKRLLTQKYQNRFRSLGPREVALEKWVLQ